MSHGRVGAFGGAQDGPHAASAIKPSANARNDFVFMRLSPASRWHHGVC